MRALPAAVLALLSSMLFAGCSRDKPVETASPAASAPADWPAFADAFIESRFQADPSFGVQSGRHEFDGQMPDWSRAAIEADVARLRAQLAELAKFDAGKLTGAQAFERKYLEWVIGTELFWRASAELPYRNPAWYIQQLDPSMYLAREYAPLPTRLRGYLGYARAIPKLAADIRANLRTLSYELKRDVLTALDVRVVVFPESNGHRYDIEASIPFSALDERDSVIANSTTCCTSAAS